MISRYDIRDWLEYGISIALVMFVAVIFVAIYLAVILLCGWGVLCVFDWLSIGIDKTLYWTGVALLILFCAFGKTTIKKEKD